MKKINFFIFLLGLLASVSLHLQAAQERDEPALWLERIGAANKRLDYVGVLTYQAGKRSETFRIIHRIGKKGAYERLEVLDGSPREIIRSGDEIRYLLPEQRVVIIERLLDKRKFPSWMVSAVTDLAENYQIQSGGKERVAGFDAQIVILKPKDKLRYRRMLWADQESGLLLKSVMQDEEGNIVEQGNFNEVQIGANVTRTLFKTSYYNVSGWRHIDTRGKEIDPELLPVSVRPPSGFKLISVVQRPLGHLPEGVMQMIFSDGLVAISVFIEPANKTVAEKPFEPMMIGVSSVYKRVVNDYQITVLGEVPATTVRELGDAIAPR